jgi:peptidoglycan/LPS O-acetylase OafA/YrhL
MSAFGPKRTWACALHMSAFGGKADIGITAAPQTLFMSTRPSLVLVFLIGGTATGIVVTIGACSILFLRSVEFGPLAIFLGSVSYSLYLVHVPIGGRVINLAKRFGEGPLYELVIAGAFGICHK